MPIEIDYRSEGFDPPPASPVSNGNAVLSTSWDELLWAAVTVGRPNRQYVFRHGTASMYEALFRWSLVRMALEQRGQTARRLRRTDAAKTLDPSEKGAVNYFLGMVLCKLFSWKCLDAPWAMHLDVFRPQLNPVLTGRSRPDLIAETSSQEWVALEAKGRISIPGNDPKAKAKQQAQRVVSVNGVAPRFYIGCITYFRNDVLQFFWRDPDPPKDKPKHPIEVTLDEGMWRHYYQPVLELLRSQSPYFEKMVHEAVLLPIKELDLEVGIHPLILEPLTHEQWGDARKLCLKEADAFHKAGYQSDGIRIAAGPTWLLPFAEFDVPSKNQKI
ncbi:MAG: hypothetical protein FJ121_01680 [Deltaproteobacteria bacterium]|nr:hypothetical protein [Deltaproteobacteria bacterium]